MRNYINILVNQREKIHTKRMRVIKPMSQLTTKFDRNYILFLLHQFTYFFVNYLCVGHVNWFFKRTDRKVNKTIENINKTLSNKLIAQ